MAVILNTSGLLDRSNLYFYILAFYVYQRDHTYVYVKKYVYYIKSAYVTIVTLKSNKKYKLTNTIMCVS